jgi:DNA-binding MarR family transcriptional regulator
MARPETMTRPSTALPAAVTDAPPRFITQYLGYLLGQANLAIYKDFEVQVNAAGLSGIEWRVLASLHDSPPMTVGQVGRAIIAQSTTTTKLVQRMSEQGWVTLTPHPTDMRSTHVAITPKALAMVLPLIEQAKQHEALALSALRATEREALKVLLRKLAAGKPNKA